MTGVDFAQNMFGLFLSQLDNLFQTSLCVCVHVCVILYLPAATKLGQVMFLQASAILSTGREGLPQCMMGYHHHPPPRSSHPIPPGSRHPPGRRHPPGSRPPQRRPPSGSRPPPEADSGIQSTSGRYASYWNTFLLVAR